MQRRQSIADVRPKEPTPNGEDKPADGETTENQNQYTKAQLFRFQTIHDYDHKSRSRHYKRELIKKFDKEIKEMREKK